ncbi:hypothetical protein ABFX02_06G193200 [Erythranthe guttata]
MYPRRMPNFFETFPVVLVDGDGIVTADVPFRRAESKYSVEQVGVQTCSQIKQDKKNFKNKTLANQHQYTKLPYLMIFHDIL